MAWPGTLTEEEQTSLLAWMRSLVRPMMGELARTNNHLAAANTEYLSTQAANLAKLDPSDVIPVEDGLNGAESLPQSEVKTLVTYMQTIVGTNGSGGVNTSVHRQGYARAAGEANIIG